MFTPAKSQARHRCSLTGIDSMGMDHATSLRVQARARSRSKQVILDLLTVLNRPEKAARKETI